MDRGRGGVLKAFNDGFACLSRTDATNTRRVGCCRCSCRVKVATPRGFGLGKRLSAHFLGQLLANPSTQLDLMLGFCCFQLLLDQARHNLQTEAGQKRVGPQCQFDQAQAFVQRVIHFCMLSKRVFSPLGRLIDDKNARLQ